MSLLLFDTRKFRIKMLVGLALVGFLVPVEAFFAWRDLYMHLIPYDAFPIGNDADEQDIFLVKTSSLYHLGNPVVFLHVTKDEMSPYGLFLPRDPKSEPYSVELGEIHFFQILCSVMPQESLEYPNVEWRDNYTEPDDNNQPVYAGYTNVVGRTMNEGDLVAGLYNEDTGKFFTLSRAGKVVEVQKGYQILYATVGKSIPITTTPTTTGTWSTWTTAGFTTKTSSTTGASTKAQHTDHQTAPTKPGEKPFGFTQKVCYVADDDVVICSDDKERKG